MEKNMNHNQSTTEDAQTIIRTTKNWKALGPEKIQNFCQKLRVMHKYADEFNRIITDST